MASNLEDKFQTLARDREGRPHQPGAGTVGLHGGRGGDGDHAPAQPAGPRLDRVQAARSPRRIEDRHDVDAPRATRAHSGHAGARRLHRELHPGGGATAAKASAEFGVPQMLSSVCNPGLEAVAAAADNFRIFQLYVRGDDAWVDDHVKRAKDNGYAAFCLTVDTASTAVASVTWPGGSSSPGARGRPATSSRPRLSWDHVKRFKDTARHSADPEGHRHRRGRRASRASTAWTAFTSPTTAAASSITGAARMDVLPEVVAAVAGRAAIIVDGGFMRGTDVVKAIASGLTPWASAGSSASASPPPGRRAWCGRWSCWRTRSVSAWACSA